MKEPTHSMIRIIGPKEIITVENTGVNPETHHLTTLLMEVVMSGEEDNVTDHRAGNVEVVDKVVDLDEEEETKVKVAAVTKVVDEVLLKNKIKAKVKVKVNDSVGAVNHHHMSKVNVPMETLQLRPAKTVRQKRTIFQHALFSRGGPRRALGPHCR